MPKIDKKITKLKHPNSRKTIAYIKQIKKVKNRQNKKTHHAMKQNVIGQKILWFQEHLQPDVSVYTPEQAEELIEKYLGRFDDELEQIEMKHAVGGRKNRQHGNREDIIRMNKKQEMEEYETCGIEVPDLLNEKQFKILRQWNGELRFLQHFKLRRFNRRQLNELKNKSKPKDSSDLVSSEMDVTTS